MQRLSGSHRQLLLFLGAVLAPGILLVASAVREQRRAESLIRQMAAETRTQAARQIAHQLRLTLEQVRLDATTVKARTDTNQPALLFAKPLGEQPRVRAGSATGQRSPAVAGRLRDAEADEFAGRSREAIELYNMLLLSTQDTMLVATARLGLARTLARVGRTTDARAHYRSLLALPFELRDDEGIPLALYAADQLKDTPEHQQAVIVRLRERLSNRELPRTLESHMLHDLAEALPPGAATDSLRTLTGAQMQKSAQLAALERDLPAIARLRSSRGVTRDGVWIPYGDPLWLVRVQTAPGSQDTLIIVADAATAAAEVAAALSALLTGPVTLSMYDREDAGEPLSPEFPGLRAHFTPAQPVAARSSVLGGPLLLLALILAGVAAYLLWRDVRRESRVSALRSRFVSAVSHELKTPLTSIRMFAEMLRMERSDEQRRAAFVDTIVGESERLSRLIENVLHFARMEEGRQRYNFTLGEVQQVVRDAAQAMQYQIEQEGLCLEVQLDDSLPPLRIDRDGMTHALLNLLSNAIKFSHKGGEISLRLERANGSAIITVSDSGVGIAPDDQTRIFEEYYRAPDAEARGIAGTGLGLALVADVVRAHGGDIRVASTPGVGSRFTLRIPLDTAQ